MQKNKTYFKNKYRINSIRLKGFDYSADGLYFVTICTHNMECWFGDVVEGVMVLNGLGKVVEETWLKMKKVRENIFSDEFIIMPNHLHGIIGIENDNNLNKKRRATGESLQCNVETCLRHVSFIKSQKSYICPFLEPTQGGAK